MTLSLVYFFRENISLWAHSRFLVSAVMFLDIIHKCTVFETSCRWDMRFDKSAVVMGFNLPGASSLNLTREHIVGIYNGTITRWNHKDLQEWNPALTMPDTPILVVARSDKSGTTEIFTSALSAFSEEWSSAFGTFSTGWGPDRKPINWDPEVITYYGYTNRGVSGLLLSLDYTIAYLSIADADENSIPYAMLVNREGYLVGPDASNVQAAMDVTLNDFSSHLTASLVNIPGPRSYPIAGFSYFILYLHSNHCASAIELYRYMEWFMFDEKAELDCLSHLLVPLSRSLALEVLRHLEDNFNCGKGGEKSVSGLVREQKQIEGKVPQTWKTPVIISSVLASLVFILFVSYVIMQQLKLNAALLKGYWKIPYDQIIPAFTTRSLLYKSNGRSPLTSFQTKLDRYSMARFSSNSSGWYQIRPMADMYKYEEHVVLLKRTQFQYPDRLRVASKRALLWAQGLRHVNIGRMLGVTEKDNFMYFVIKFDAKGVLHDILQDDKYDLDDNFKFCLSLDVAAGMAFLHGEGLIHGNLSSSSCCIDDKWNVKVVDWMLCKIAEKENDPKMLNFPYMAHQSADNEDTIAKSCFIYAPELLKGDIGFPTKETDIYSFAMMMVEIFTREDPYQEVMDVTLPKDVLKEIMDNDLRPMFPKDHTNNGLCLILSLAWSVNPNERPTFPKIIKSLNAVRPSRKGLLDCMMEVLRGYVERLEEKVEERTAELAKATESMRTLLHQILPPNVADRLQQGLTVNAEHFESVTVYFSDIVGFTLLSSMSTPMQIVQFLNSLYTCFDAVLDKYDVYKVETIGDAYMVISGVPVRNGISHAGHIATMALDLMKATSEHVIPHLPGEKLQLRAGMHSGPVAAGVVGSKMPRYCLFGDTVNTASRMEGSSHANMIQMTEASKGLLVRIGGYKMEKRGLVTVKGKGEMCTYWLLGKDKDIMDVDLQSLESVLPSQSQPSWS